jgi:hypothetical protein
LVAITLIDPVVLDVFQKFPDSKRPTSDAGLRSLLTTLATSATTMTTSDSNGRNLAALTNGLGTNVDAVEPSGDAMSLEMEMESESEGCG